MNHLAPLVVDRTPALVAVAGARAQIRLLEFFAANTRNIHTRRAYAQATREFLAWCDSGWRRVDPTPCSLCMSQAVDSGR